MLTEKDYCNLEITDELRKLGYPKWPYEAMDMDSRLRIIPLYNAQKWLREEKGMNVYVKAFNGDGWYYTIQNCKGVRIYPPLARIVVLCHFYEEALLEGIKEAIKILKEEK